MSMLEILSGERRWWVEHGDCLERLKLLPDDSVDAIVTDPPAGIAFMGKGWDEFGRVNDRSVDPTKNNKGLLPSYGRGGTPEDRRKANNRARDAFIPWLASILTEGYRVLKPGGRMLCWSIPRTMHWTGTAIEDAGFSIENDIPHYYAEHMPPDVAEWLAANPLVSHMFGSGFPKAKSQLKPAREDWWLARKPAKLVLPLNIDACRIATTDDLNGPAYSTKTFNETPLPGDTRSVASQGMLAPGSRAKGEFVQPSGRWPANVLFSHVASTVTPEGEVLAQGCVRVGTKRVKSHNPGNQVLDEGADYGSFSARSSVGHADADGKESVEDWQCVDGCPVRLLDSQSGVTSVTGKRSERSRNAVVEGTQWATNNHRSTEYPGDSGGASRFFHCFEPEPFIYQAKASRKDRNEGCEPSEPRLRLRADLSPEQQASVIEALRGRGVDV